MVYSDTMEHERTEQLRKIKDEVLALTGSPLYAERAKNGVHPVIGEGSHFARLMFIGEAPGRNEAATGRPFVGAAGKVLDTLLASADIKREEVSRTSSKTVRRSTATRSRRKSPPTGRSWTARSPSSSRRSS
jgi:DNA polymerase